MAHYKEYCEKPVIKIRKTNKQDDEGIRKRSKPGKPDMSLKKHRKCGHPTKGPKLKFQIKMEAEANEIKDRSRIKNPKSSIKELFK